MKNSILNTHPMLIIVFGISILIMLLLDLGVFNKKTHEVSNKEAVVWSFVWITLAMFFSVLVFYIAGSTKFYEFQSAYWIEKSLSVDNLFVFIMVFKFFDVANQNKHKVLFWGILGALLLRAIFIFSGTYLIELTYIDSLLKGNFSNVIYILLNFFFALPLFLGILLFRNNSKVFISLFFISLILIFSINFHKVSPSIKEVQIPHINLVMTFFGLFLVYAGIKSWFSGNDDEDEDYNNTKGAKLIRKLFPVTDKYDGGKFFTFENGKKFATPLLVVLAVIEFTDLLFAVDSIPAIFAISNDPFILYTSNIFAILGLRALFFLLDNFIHLFSKLPYGLAFVLSFIGIKMIISPFYHIESVHSLMFIGGVLIISVVLSILTNKKGQI
jgi:tellurite resistance protein TerC